MDYLRKLELVPIWHRSTLSVDEAVAYSGIGRDKLLELSNLPECEFVLWCGNRRLIKRRKLEEYIAKAYSL